MIQYLRNLGKKGPPYSDEEVNTVRDLLNEGSVYVDDVSKFLNVPKDVVIEGLTGIPKGSSQTNQINSDQAQQIEKLIKKGVMTVPEVSEYFGAAPEVVEDYLVNTAGYNEGQLQQANRRGRVTDRYYKLGPAREIPRVAPAAIPAMIRERLGFDPSTIGSNIAGLRDSGAIAQAGDQASAQTTTTGSQAAEQTAMPGIATTQYATGGEIPTGLRGSEMALKGGATGAIEMLDQLNRAGRADLQTQYGLGLEQAQAAADTATGFMQPYEQAGQTALQQQLALSGALGQEAFDQAYQESPQMAFLREQGMRANLAGAAATGGLGGGNVQKELQRFGQGLASQGLQQQIGNLGALSGQGYGAAGTMANIATNLGSQQLGTQTNLGNQLAAYGLSTGLPAAQTISTLGTNLASGRTRAGEMLASQYGQTAQQLGGIYSGQGRDIASMTDQQRRMIMDAVNSGAMTEAQAQQAYSTNMANLQSSIGSQLAGVPNAPIFAPDYGQQIGQAFQAGGVGAYIGGQMGGQSTQPSGMSPGFNTFFANPNMYYPSPNMMQPAPTTVGMPTLNVNKVA